MTRRTISAAIILVQLTEEADEEHGAEPDERSQVRAKPLRLGELLSLAEAEREGEK